MSTTNYEDQVLPDWARAEPFASDPEWERPLKYWTYLRSRPKHQRFHDFIYGMKAQGPRALVAPEFWHWVRESFEVRAEQLRPAASIDYNVIRLIERNRALTAAGVFTVILFDRQRAWIDPRKVLERLQAMTAKGWLESSDGTYRVSKRVHDYPRLVARFGLPRTLRESFRWRGFDQFMQLDHELVLAATTLPAGPQWVLCKVFDESDPSLDPDDSSVLGGAYFSIPDWHTDLGRAINALATVRNDVEIRLKYLVNTRLDTPSGKVPYFQGEGTFGTKRVRIGILPVDEPPVEKRNRWLPGTSFFIRQPT